MRSSAVRNQQCPMCEQVPDLLTTQDEGDGFTRGVDQVVQVCNVI